LGNDSLVAVSGAARLLGGVGSDILVGGTGANFLKSGSSTSSQHNTLIGGSGANTLVAGLGKDSIVGGSHQNLLLITSQAQAAAFASDNLSLSTLSSASNSLGVSSATAITIQDSLFAGASAAKTARPTTSNIGSVINLGTQGNPAVRMILSTLAQNAGVQSLIAGPNSDTLSTAGFGTTPSLAASASAYLSASLSSSKASLTGSNAGNDTLVGSQQGYDTLSGGGGNDIFFLQNSNVGSITGGAGTDTISMIRPSALDYKTFNGISGVEVLSLAGGTSQSGAVNSVGSLQGSGITTIYGGAGVDSDTITAGVVANVLAVTFKGSKSIKLATPAGASGSVGFAMGQYVSGDGLAPGTMITGVTVNPAVGKTPATVTLQLNKPTSSLVGQGTLVTGYLNGISIIGSVSGGQKATAADGAAALKKVINLSNAANGIYEQYRGLPNELALDVQALLDQQSNPLTYIGTQGDYLVVGGTGEFVSGAISTTPDSLLSSSITFTDSYGNKRDGISFYSHVVANNTIVSGMFNNSGTASLIGAQNTLVGGPGNNTYILNNLPGDTLLPYIQNLQFNTIVGGVAETLQSGSTITFSSNGVQLTDNSFANVGAGTAQVIKTANGNNLIQIGQNATPIGIQTIIGGVGSDTFVALPTLDQNGDFVPYQPSVLFDASRGSGNQFLQSGSGNDTLLAGTGNATLLGGDGNNSLRGGNGNNLILSGIGNSTLDGGLGVSTLQADGGTNTFIVRSSGTRILAPYSLEYDSVSGGILPPSQDVPSNVTETGIVNSYVNFDPIQGSPSQSLSGPYQFAPQVPDGSPSLLKMPSFASSDLASFYLMAKFNLLGTARYGVGNALDNSMTSAAANALMLGMGGRNTLVAAGAGSSLYGNSNASYASPDLYATAPIDTRTQAFMDGVMGVAGDNSLVANGANSYLDGGSGYDDGLFGSGANTLVGTAANDTFIQNHQSDVIVSGANGTLLSKVDLYNIPDGINQFILDVTPMAANSGELLPPVGQESLLPGQRKVASYGGAGSGDGHAHGGNLSIGWTFGKAPVVQATNVDHEMQIQYGISDGTVYGPGGNLPLSVAVAPSGNQATLTWTTPLDPYGNPVGQTLGYVVQYQCQYTDADGNTVPSPWLTYLNGTSQDLEGSPDNPTLTVDNLPTTITDGYTSATYQVTGYQFKVTAQETVLPASTDTDPNSPTFGQLIATPVTLVGGDGNDVLYSGLPYLSSDSNGTSYSQLSGNRPVLNNHPLPPGGISYPGPWLLTTTSTGAYYPTYLDAGNGNNLLFSWAINPNATGYGSGEDFTSYEYINGEPKPVTYSGLNTLVGGSGSDTILVSNGGTDLIVDKGVVTTSPYDEVIKGINLDPTIHNLIISNIPYLSLSDTTVSQGMYIDQAWSWYDGQYIGGNRLNNTLSAYSGGDTLLGGLGNDSLYTTGGSTLIGGNEYGLDNVGLAITEHDANPTVPSIHRDTDPVPVTPNGPGTADPSQYGFGNSDTLNASAITDSTKACVLDGGRGNDSMVGGAGTDTLYVSALLGKEHNGQIRAGDIVVGGGSGVDKLTGNGVGDWIVYTGSDVYWSGENRVYNTYNDTSLVGTASIQSTLGYALDTLGDSSGGQSISNIKLQDGDPIALFATGNFNSTGDQHDPKNSKLLSFGSSETGSNQLVGNESSNTLNGQGVGSTQNGYGCDTLTGGDGSDFFIVGSGYTNSSSDLKAGVNLDGFVPTDANGYSTWRSDADYVVITDMSASDTLILAASTTPDGASDSYFIGTAPNGYHQYNIHGTQSAPSPLDFGIYKVTAAGPNLVAEVQGLAFGGKLTVATIGGIDVDGHNNHLGGDATTTGTNSALAYLGVGAMYNLTGSNFASHVTFA
jgi:Ca2+-binding RTX toxin-like protein